MSTLYLHIGFPKTATTFIQKVLLPEISSINCFSKPHVRLGDRKDRFGTRFYYSPQLWPDKGKELLSQFLGPEPQGEVDEDVLISDEGFGGGLTGPEPWIPASRPHHDKDNGPHLTCAHLEEFQKLAMEWGFSRMKVVMGIRRQDRKMASGYAQMSHKVRGASQEGFERWVRRVIDPNRGYYDGGGVQHNYYLFWQKITEVLGAENTLVLPLELLKEERSVYLSRLFGFLEIPDEGKRIKESLSESENLKRNARSSSKDTWGIRTPMRRGPCLRPGRLFGLLGMEFPYKLPLRWPDFQRGEEICLTPELREFILGIYSEENRRLDRAIEGLDLRSYGYWSSSQEPKPEKKEQKEEKGTREEEKSKPQMEKQPDKETLHV